MWYTDVVYAASNTDWASSAWGQQALAISWKMYYHFCGNNGPLKMEEITPKMINDYVEEELHGCSSATVNRHLAVLSKLYTVAQRHGYTGTRPFIPRQKEKDFVPRWLTHEEEATLIPLIDEMVEHGEDITIILVDTGMRLGEFYKLEEDSILWSSNLIHIKESKSGKPRAIPMTERCQKAVSNLFDPKVAHPPSPADYRAAWQHARYEMGRMDDPGFTPHILRHTCASRLVQSGVPIAVVQQWLGHSNIAMTMRYAHLSPDNLKNALNALEEHNE